MTKLNENSYSSEHREGETCFDIRRMNLFYTDFHALKDVRSSPPGRSLR